MAMKKIIVDNGGNFIESQNCSLLYCNVLEINKTLTEQKWNQCISFDIKTHDDASKFPIWDRQKMVLKNGLSSNHLNKICNKLGLSCAKLRASIILSGLDKILVYLYWLTLFWFANLAFEFHKSLIRFCHFLKKTKWPTLD